MHCSNRLRQSVHNDLQNYTESYPNVHSHRCANLRSYIMTIYNSVSDVCYAYLHKVKLDAETPLSGTELGFNISA